MKDLSILVAATSLTLMACGPDVDSSAVVDEISSTSQALAIGAYDVGVIPAAGYTCPNETIYIYMDDEDSSNANSYSGWIGRTISNTNTRFTFCRVDGAKFKPVDTSYDSWWHYAVLRLGSACPPGSEPFSRYFDNEDTNNTNYYIGSIYPNASSTNTRLQFCLFRGASSAAYTMYEFPSLGFAYGVFANPNRFWLALNFDGYVYTDDEDNGNANGYSYSSSAVYWAAQQIISDGSNTRLYMSLVRNGI